MSENVISPHRILTKLLGSDNAVFPQFSRVWGTSARNDHIENWDAEQPLKTAVWDYCLSFREIPNFLPNTVIALFLLGKEGYI